MASYMSDVLKVGGSVTLVGSNFPGTIEQFNLVKFAAFGKHKLNWEVRKYENDSIIEYHGKASGGK